MTIQTSHLVFWLAAIPAAGLVYVFGIAIYRLFFHPLSKYPGPLLAKLTDGYSLYHAWKGDRHLDFWRLHERYGPVVRFGPNSLSFNTSTSLKTIYSHSANVLKSDFYDAFVGAAPSTHSTRDKADHARKRRVLSHAFSPRAMREVEQYILASERTLARRVGESANPERKGWSAPQNMTHWFNYLATDILGDLCFGKAFHMLEKEDNRYVVDLVASATKRHLICGTMPIIHKLGIDKWLFPGIAARRAKYFEYSRAVLTERTNFGEKHDRPDFFYHLMKAKDPETGKGFTTPELWGESNLLIIAGSDTTSTALAATVFYLVRDIPALEKVTSEVRAKFASVDDIRQGPALNELTYLRACIDEAMRLSPSVGGILPREVQRGGLVVDGHAVPAGTVVGTPHYAIHHNAAYFARPFAFRPERWLAGAKNPETGRPVRAEEVEEAAAAFCPFSVGPRGCIGKEVAYLEMKTALARLLFLYDLRKARDVADPAEGKEGAELGREKVGEFQLFDTFTSWKDGPMVEFRLRDGVEAA